MNAATPFSPYLLLAGLLGYVGLLVAVGSWAERAARQGRHLTNHGWVYALTLTVYCTSWTYFGSVGSAANHGMLYSAIYLGPTLLMLVAWGIVRRMIRLRHRYQFSSVVDLITQRYGQSVAMGAFITLVLLLGMIPYIALQIRAVLGSFSILTGMEHSRETLALGHFADELMVLLIGGLTVLFGLRRVDTRVRQHGMVAVLAVESVVKLVGFVAVGLFVTYGLFDGLADLQQRVAADPSLGQRFSGSEPPAGAYLNWMSYLVLSMAAILFLPRMFHVMVVENHDERHLATAIWLFPLYLLVISFFVLPIAVGGLLLGHPASAADWFVIRLPFDHGSPALALLSYLGGFSAAIGMVMVAGTAVAIMVSNHVILPLVDQLPFGHRLHGRLRGIRWSVVFVVLALSYSFQYGLADSYLLIQMGLISFAAMLQFAPAAFGALYWARGSRAGAWWGLGLGWAVWAYTLFLPALARSGVGDPGWVAGGPFGIAFLRPDALFGLDLGSAMFNACFWSLLFNLLGYVLGSVLHPPSADELPTIENYRKVLGDNVELEAVRRGDVRIDFARVRSQVAGLFRRYLPPTEAELAAGTVLDEVTVIGDQTISGRSYLSLAERVENTLAGTIGAAMARKAVIDSLTLDEAEAAGLEKTWTQQLTELRITPQQLREQVDYFHRLNELANQHGQQMESKVKALEDAMKARDHADAALRESELRFRSLADSAPVLIWLCDSVDGADFFNSAWCAFAGGAPDAKAGGAWSDSIHPDERAAVLGLIALALERHHGIEQEFRLRRHDGEYRDMRVQVLPRHSADGKFLGMIGSAVDVSDLKAAEATLRRSNQELEDLVSARTTEMLRSFEELRDSEETIRAITASAQDAVIMLDGLGRVSFWNPAGERLFGWSTEEALGRRLDDFLLPERFRAAHRAAYERFQQGEHGAALGNVVELVALDKAGNEIPVELALSSTTLHGELHAIGLLRDITDRKSAEAALRQSYAELKEINRRLEEAQNQLLQSEKMASIGQLAAGVAHEINNPVGFVSSNLGTLKTYSVQLLELIAAYEDGENQLADPALRTAIESLKRELDLEFLREDLPALIAESEEGLVRVKKIVQDLKDFSHVNESDWQQADLNAGLESTLNVVWNEVKYKAKVVKQYGELPPVECLAAQLNQVFMNLIVNAVHALDESKGMGTLTLSTGHAGDEVWVEVRDNGKGMTEEVKKRIFEPFFTTKPVGKGTGLGLSLSFNIVQKHHGRIEVDSAPGEGTRFRVWVPVRRQLKEAA